MASDPVLSTIFRPETTPEWGYAIEYGVTPEEASDFIREGLTVLDFEFVRRSTSYSDYQSSPWVQDALQEGRSLLDLETYDRIVSAFGFL